MASNILRGIGALSVLLLLALPAGAVEPVATSPAIDTSKPNPLPEFSLSARAKGERGTAIVYVKVNENGEVLRVLLGKTCGYHDLDESALTAVKQWRFHPALADGRPVTKWTAVGVLFSLGSVKASPEDVDAGFNENTFRQTGYNPEQVVCRTDDAPTGSHLPGPRVCHTQKQWDEIADRAHRGVGEFANPNGDLSGN